MSLDGEIRRARRRQNRQTSPKKEPPAQESGFEVTEEQAKIESYLDRFEKAVTEINWEQMPSPYTLVVRVEEFHDQQFDDLETAVDTAKSFQDHDAFHGME